MNHDGSTCVRDKIPREKGASLDVALRSDCLTFYVIVTLGQVSEV